jgi:cAMP-binding proteins - catabolite gene activator and regulatory subunit of cAMP-dependent protein kinases
MMQIKEMLTNKILSGLHDTEFMRLMPQLEPVSLFAGERLAVAGELADFIYFPENSIVSCQADMMDGKSAEVGMIGKEGVAGLSSILNACPPAHSLNVTVAGSALRMKRAEFEHELQRGEGLRQSLFAYAGEYLTQVSQRSACAVLHHIEQRFAIWLLLLTDRLDTDTIQITQERIAQHLGVRRAGISVIAGELQALGAISYTRGSMCVVNRQALKHIACECYGALAVNSQQTTYS